MEDRDLPYVKEYHQRLIATSSQARQLRVTRLPHPGWKDALLDRLGCTLISLGQRLQAASLHNQYEVQAELSTECA
jgi:hypothetical protein